MAGGPPHGESGRRRPGAVAGGAYDAGLVDVAGAHQAGRARVSDGDWACWRVRWAYLEST